VNAYPVGNSRDGAIFFWLGESSRPDAVVQVSLSRNGRWYQEFISLSPALLSAESRDPAVAAWTPARSGGQPGSRDPKVAIHPASVSERRAKKPSRSDRTEALATPADADVCPYDYKRRKTPTKIGECTFLQNWEI
jgi:hypothetical protein